MGEKQERETEPQGAHNDKEHRVEKKASLADLGQLLKEDMNKNLCFTSRKGALAQHFLHAGTSSNALNSLLSLSLFGSLMSVFDVETNTISKREGVCVCVSSAEGPGHVSPVGTRGLLVPHSSFRSTSSPGWFQGHDCPG